MNGPALATAGAADALAADCSVTRQFATLVREAVDELCWSPEPFDAEHARAIVAERYPDARPHSANVLPAVLGSLASAGRIRAVGHTRCTRSSRRHGWMRVWQVVQSPSLPPGEVEKARGGGRGPSPASHLPGAT